MRTCFKIHFALLLCILQWTSEHALQAQTVLYQSEVDFPSPSFETGALAGQDGWESAVNYSINSAQVVSYAAGQAVEIFGPFVAAGAPNFYNGFFTQSLEDYDPIAEGTPIVSVSADIWMNLGPTAAQASWLFGFLVLDDENGVPYATVGVDKHGVVFGQNFASPNQVVTSPNPGTNTFHVLRSDYNFSTRQVTFYMDGASLGSMPFNPSSGTLASAVGIQLESSNPIDSNLVLDNLSVTAGNGIPPGGCVLAITQAGPCLGNGTAGTPNVGDLYGVRVTFNDSGTPYQPFRIKFTIANVTWYSDYIDYIYTGNGWWNYFDWWVNLDGPLPWSVTLDPDGVSGSTNVAAMTASGVFTPTPPSAPLQLYNPVTVGGTEEWYANFEPGSGVLSELYVAFGSPTTHGAQQVISVTGPTNATQIVTGPYGIPAYFIARTNVSAGAFQANESFRAQINAMRVNPALLRTNTWAQLAALPTNITQWLTPDSYCQSTSPAISNFVSLYLPANYKSTMTPYDTAQALQKAVMRSLIYLEPPPYVDATNCLQGGLADCGGYAALLTASLRNAGIPARRLSGFWEGDGWQNDPQWHIRAEYYLPNTGWLITDACVGNENDPTGNFSWDFSFVPDANDFLAMDVGDQHLLPNANYAELQVPNWYYYCDDCPNYLSNGAISYLQPLGAISAPSIANDSANLSITNVPYLGTLSLQTSTNLTFWMTVANYPSPGGDPINYSVPVTNRWKYFRALQVP